jgi:hypothetical protein
MILLPKFRELERALLRDRHLLAIHSGVPFLLLVYPPEQERLCRELQAELMEKLRARNTPVIEHRLDTFIFDYYEQRFKDQGGVERIFQLERHDPDALRRMVSGIYEGELVARILATVSRAEPNGVIFLTRVGAMYPFGRISNLLVTLENRISLPLVVFYPGIESAGQLSFLGLEQHTGYRARVI